MQDSKKDEADAVSWNCMAQVRHGLQKWQQSAVLLFSDLGILGVGRVLFFFSSFLDTRFSFQKDVTDCSKLYRKLKSEKRLRALPWNQ